MNEVKFKGDIVICDPCNIAKSEEDWALCEYGERMDKLGFTDFLYMEFPDDPPIVIDGKGNRLGTFCQDSGVIVVVYLNELEKYNPDYEAALFDEDNRAIIKGFEGKVGYRIEPVIVDGYEEDTDTVIFGEGNFDFRTVYEEDL